MVAGPEVVAEGIVGNTVDVVPGALEVVGMDGVVGAVVVLGLVVAVERNQICSYEYVFH